MFKSHFIKTKQKYIQNRHIPCKYRLFAAIVNSNYRANNSRPHPETLSPEPRDVVAKGIPLYFCDDTTYDDMHKSFIRIQGVSVLMVSAELPKRDICPRTGKVFSKKKTDFLYTMYQKSIIHIRV